MTQTKKMKTIKTLALLLGLALGIASCSKEGQDNPVLVEQQAAGESKHVGSKDSVLVSFTIGADTESLRLAQSLNADGAPVSPFMEEKDVVIRFAVRKSGRVTYTNAVCKKVAGENLVTYKGKISLPDLDYGNTTPNNLTGHQIAGVLLGEANGGTQFVETVDANTVKSIEQTELLLAESSVVRTQIPYILDWVDFPLTAQGVQTQKQVLNFKPVGNLLRIQLNNQFDEAKTLEAFKLSSNALVTEAKFDFSKQGSLRVAAANYSSTIPTTMSGSPMQTLTASYRMEKTYQLSTPIEIEAKSRSKWYYLWVMPLVYNAQQVNNGTISFRTQVVGRGQDGKDYNMLAICSRLSEGSNKLSMSFKIASTVETAFKGGKLPLWYVAEYDVAHGGKTLRNTNTMLPSQRHIPGSTLEHVRTYGFFKPSELQSIEVPGYYLPSVYEMTAVQPLYNPSDPNKSLIILPTLHPKHNRTIVSQRYIGLGEARTIIEEVLFPGEVNPVETSSVFQLVEEPDAVSGAKKYVLYALRFEQCGERDKLSAYRYSMDNYMLNTNIYNTFATATSTTDINFEVSSVFLGSGFTGDIKDIAKPSFWERNDVVTRVFPITGVGQPNLSGNYETIDKAQLVHRILRNETNGSVWAISVDILISSLWTPGTGNQVIERNLYPVRLMKDEFKTAK